MGKQGVEYFCDEMDKLIDLCSDEYNMNCGEIVGALFVKAWLLVEERNKLRNEAKPDELMKKEGNK